MRKLSLLFVTVALLLIGSRLKAELPALTSLPPIVSLPYTFSPLNNGGSIDIDGDNHIDYYFTFSSNPGGNYCEIDGISVSLGISTGTGSGTGYNLILSEFIPIEPSSPAAALSSPKLGFDGPPFCRMMEKGEMVGPDDGYDYGGASWYDWSYIMFEGDFFPFSPALAGNSYEDGILKGYIGTYFSGSTGWHYGWLNVEIDPEYNWLKINSAGYNTGTSMPVPAGLGDPFAVPVPLIASILGFGLIGGGAFLRRKKKANK